MIDDNSQDKCRNERPFFEPCELPPQLQALREEVRSFLEGFSSQWSSAQRARSWDGYDPAFSRALGARGWIGMTWPKHYGGGERTALERYAVIEELLFAGAPVAAHRIADRQSGPLLLRFGAEQHRREILPRIARGELCFCIGLSEPDAGSDVASIRSRAREVDGGWLLSGTKLWTTSGHHADYMIGLFRTRGSASDRHHGLSQFLVDLRRPNIKVRPVPDLTGREHFNEITFDDVLLTRDDLIGVENEGWAQAMTELALERSGPKRFLSSVQALVHLNRAVSAEPSEESCVIVGRLVAQLVTLRKMSLSIAGMLQAGRDPTLEASIVKDRRHAKLSGISAERRRRGHHDE